MVYVLLILVANKIQFRTRVGARLRSTNPKFLSKRGCSLMRYVDTSKFLSSEITLTSTAHGNPSPAAVITADRSISSNLSPHTLHQSHTFLRSVRVKTTYDITHLVQLTNEYFITTKMVESQQSVYATVMQ